MQNKRNKEKQENITLKKQQSQQKITCSACGNVTSQKLVFHCEFLLHRSTIEPLMQQWFHPPWNHCLSQLTGSKTFFFPLKRQNILYLCTIQPIADPTRCLRIAFFSFRRDESTGFSYGHFERPAILKEGHV